MSFREERSPLLQSAKKPNSRAYSQSSSREEARPFDMEAASTTAATVAGSPLASDHSYQHGGGSVPEAHAAPFMGGQNVPQGGGDGREQDEDEQSPLVSQGGPMVICRVCEADISLVGKETQHVVRCQQCNEVTPIRAAAPGKKYVRCPCNCLLVCKASSTRIACPRANCRRVITLAASSPMGTAVRAPPGTCRVQCVHCMEVFMFNALTNAVAHCPHCKRASSVGARFARSRVTFFFVATVVSVLILIGLIIGTVNTGAVGFLSCSLWALFALLSCYFLTRVVHYARLKISQVLGPI